MRLSLHPLRIFAILVFLLALAATSWAVCGPYIIYGCGYVSGTHCDDIIVSTCGPGESMRVYARGGDDEVWGSTGNDEIHLGSGNDFAFGDEGDDKIYGGSGNDQLEGWSGNDELHGGYGNDLLLGDSGVDVGYGDPNGGQFYTDFCITEIERACD